MDAIAILVDLTRRVARLESTRTIRHRRSVEPGTAALLAIHAQIKAADNRDIQAITRWLMTPTKKNAPDLREQAEGNTTERNGNV